MPVMAWKYGCAGHGIGCAGHGIGCAGHGIGWRVPVPEPGMGWFGDGLGMGH